MEDYENCSVLCCVQQLCTVIPGKIITELSVRRCDHQETGGDLEGARVPPG